MILPESTIDEVINGDKFASGNQSYQDIRKNTLGESWGVFGNGLNQFTMDVVDLVAGNNANEVKEVKRTVSIDQSFLNYSITDNLQPFFSKFMKLARKIHRANICRKLLQYPLLLRQIYNRGVVRLSCGKLPNLCLYLYRNLYYAAS